MNLDTEREMNDDLLVFCVGFERIVAILVKQLTSTKLFEKLVTNYGQKS